MAIDAHRDAKPAAAQGNAALCGPIGDNAGQLVTVIGIIDAVGGIRAEIGDLVALFDQPVAQLGLQIDGGMVGSNGDTHGCSA